MVLKRVVDIAQETYYSIYFFKKSTFNLALAETPKWIRMEHIEAALPEDHHLPYH